MSDAQYRSVHVSQKALHFGDVGHLNVNHLKALVLNAADGVVMVSWLVMVAVGAMSGRYRHHLGEVGKVHSVFSLFAAGDDREEVVAPHDLLRDVGSPDLAGRAGGLGRAVEKHHELKLLLMQSVHRHVEERAGFVDYVV